MSRIGVVITRSPNRALLSRMSTTVGTTSREISDIATSFAKRLQSAQDHDIGTPVVADCHHERGHEPKTHHHGGRV